MTVYQHILYQVKSGIVGLAIGDALGVPVEFGDRELRASDPVKGMRGYGFHPVPVGTWSDDTSMTIATLDSLSGGVLDYDDIMGKFVLWMEQGAYTATDEVFDVGNTCYFAIKRFSLANEYIPAITCGSTDEYANGNGSLMRMLPFVLYHVYTQSDEDFLDMIHKASAMTHGHRRSQIGCGIYACVLRRLLQEPSLASVKQGLLEACDAYEGEEELPAFARLFSPNFADMDVSHVRSSGYVVDTLEAALWCLLNTDNYTDCVLKAVNLGQDTDTTAAVAGSLAGVMYGYDHIPSVWLDALIRREAIEEMCKQAAKTWSQNRITEAYS